MPKKTLLYFFTLLACLSLAMPVFAQGSISGLEFLGIPADAKIGDVIAALYVYGVGFVALAALIVFTAGGVLYIFAGDKDPSKAKEWMKNAFWGLVLALTSWLILYTINPKLVEKLDLKLQTIQTSTTESMGQPAPSVPNILISDLRAACAARDSHPVVCETDGQCATQRNFGGFPTGCGLASSVVAQIQTFCTRQRDSNSCSSNVNCQPVLNANGDFSRCRLR